MVKTVKSSAKSKNTFLSEEVINSIRAYRPVISNSNGKGGVGKTTLSVYEIWFCTQLLGLKAVVIDFDVDMHISKMLFGEEKAFELASSEEYAVTSDLFTDNELNKPILEHPSFKNLFVIPADFALESADRKSDGAELSLFPYFHIQSLRESYDVVIIDCPPGKGFYRNSGLLPANLTVLITQMSYISFSAVSSAIKITDEMVSRLNSENIDFQFNYTNYLVVPNLYKAVRKEHREALSSLKESCSISNLKITSELKDFGPIENSANVRRPVWEFKDGNSRSAAKNLYTVLSHILESSVAGAK